MTIEKDFRSAEDHKRTAQAKLVAETTKGDRDAAQAALTAAEEACVSAPTPKAFEKAKAARLVLDDAERVYAYALHHVAKVEYENIQREREAMRAEIDRLEANRTSVVNEEIRELVVEIGMLSAQLHDRLLANESARRAEHDEIQELRQRAGLATAGWHSPWSTEEHRSLVKLAWAAQGDAAGLEQAGGFFAPVALVLDVVRSSSRTTAVQQYGEEVKALAQRVAARRSSSDKGKSLASLAKAAVGTLATIAALTLSGG